MVSSCHEINHHILLAFFFYPYLSFELLYYFSLSILPGIWISHKWYITSIYIFFSICFSFLFLLLFFLFFHQSQIHIYSFYIFYIVIKYYFATQNNILWLYKWHAFSSWIWIHIEFYYSIEFEAMEFMLFIWFSIIEPFFSTNNIFIYYFFLYFTIH